MHTKTTILSLCLLFGLVQGQAFRGVNYGIQRGDGSCPNYQQVLADFNIIKGTAQAVKIYTMAQCNAAALVLQAAQATGLKVFLGIQAAPEDAFGNEKAILQQVYRQFGFGNVLGITVGSEDLYRGSVSADSLAQKIYDVKGLVRSLGSQVPITHTDVYYLQPQNIIDADDIVMFNAFPYWEGVNIDAASQTMIDHYNQVKSQAKGKTVWIGETAWPNAGGNTGAAVASSQNMQQYINQFICWANANGVPYFYFEAFDEPWKGAGVESNWGLYTNDRKLKSSSTPNCGAPATSATVAPTTTTAAPSTAKPSTSSTTTAAPSTSSTVKPSSSSTTTAAPSTSSTAAPSTVKPSTSQSTTKAPVSSATTAPSSSGTCNKAAFCPVGTCTCNVNDCYSPSQYDCTTDNKGAKVLCAKGTLSCNGGCYDPSRYRCGSNGLVQN